MFDTLNTIDNFLTEIEANLDKVEYISKRHTFRYNDLEVRLNADFNVGIHSDDDPYYEVIVVSRLTDRGVYRIAYNGDEEWRAKGREVAVRITHILDKAHKNQWNLGQKLEEQFVKLYK